MLHWGNTGFVGGLRPEAQAPGSTANRQRACDRIGEGCQYFAEVAHRVERTPRTVKSILDAPRIPRDTPHFFGLLAPADTPVIDHVDKIPTEN